MRTLEDWESAASRIWYVVNDHNKTQWLHQDILWLGMLDVKIQTAKLGGDTPFELLREKIMHSKLWILQAYEIIRAMNEFDDYPTNIEPRDDGKINKTGYFTKTKWRLEIIRIPMAKYQKIGSDESSHINIRIDTDGNIVYIPAHGREITYESISKTVFDTFNNYVRPEKYVTQNSDK